MSKKPNYVFDDELYHYGILGQRWGHRRFQNEDGSWTAEGRERYGEGDERTKAKIAYNTQKYKADLNSKAQKEKVTRTAKEERHRIKENSKTSRLARKEQGKFDRLNKKENAKLDRQGRSKLSFGRTRNMSDDDLAKAINRLKLQAEYNKQYVLATQPSNALVKADRFFEGPTGKFVSQLALQTLPDVTKTIVTKTMESNLKYANPIDRDKAKVDIAKARAELADKNKPLSELDRKSKEADIAFKKAQAAQQMSVARNNTKQLLGKDNYEYYVGPDGRLRIRKK